MNHKMEKEIINYLKELSTHSGNTKAKDIYERYISEHTEVNGVFILNEDIIRWYIRMRFGTCETGLSPKVFVIKELRSKCGTRLVESKNIADEISTGKYCVDVKNCFDMKIWKY